MSHATQPLPHTPGPWHRNISPATKYPTIWAGRNTHVAVLNTRLGDEAVEANANLVAAAPDLLVALDDLVRELEVCVEDGAKLSIYATDSLQHARNKIAKARGAA